MRQVNFIQLLPLIEETLKAGGRFPLTVTGTSMEPFLHEHSDTVFIEQKKETLKLGDIVFVLTSHGPILHRISKIENDVFYMTGDAQILPEGPFSDKELIGVVYEYRRKNKKRKANTKGIRLLVKLNRIKHRIGRTLTNHKSKT